MQPASVSVIIPTYNCASLLPEAIESVLAQTVPPAQIIVVDDGSQDDTQARLQRFGSRIEVHTQTNGGVATARNRGLTAARGELIAFLDADDWWHPRKLERQIAVMEQNPRLGFLGTKAFEWPGPVLDSTCELTPTSLAEVSWPELVIKNYFTTSSVVVRQSFLQKVGGFDPELRGPEDHDLWLRIAEISAVGNLALPLTGYRYVVGSLGQQATSMEAGMRRILEKLERQRPLPWRLRCKAQSYCNYSCAYMHSAAGSPRTALVRLLGSFAWYPLPFRRNEVRMPWARPRLLAETLRRLSLQCLPSVTKIGVNNP